MITKNKAIVAIALLGCIAGSAQAGERVHYQCESTVKGKCPPPPIPPAPPAPPLPPTLPARPAPPVPPALPEVPAAAHAACAGQAEGTRITHVPGKGETMTGVCEREDGKPVFQLREYRIHD